MNGEFPAATLADEIETPGEGRIRAILSVATNPVRSYPGSERLDRAFAALDFYVAVDIYVNESTRHANVILPPPSALEEENYELTFLGNAVRSIAKYAPPVFPRTADAGPSEADLFAKLALILRGEGAKADPARVHDALRRRSRSSASEATPRARSPAATRARSGAPSRATRPSASSSTCACAPAGRAISSANAPAGSRSRSSPNIPTASTSVPMVERFPARLATESGYLELTPAPLVEDWRRVRERLDDPLPADGLLLIGRRHVRSNNSWMHNIESLVSGRSRCTLLMNPDDAKGRGLENGASAEIHSRVGKLEVEVETSDAMMPGVVSLPHGWGHDVPGVRMRVASAHAGVASNVLTDDRVIDVASGNAVLNGIAVELMAVR